VSIEMNPIGFVRTDAEKVPRSWRASDVEGVLVVDEAYKEGLGDIERAGPAHRGHLQPPRGPRFPQRLATTDTAASASGATGCRQ
jgi:hypothetical protein